MIRTIICDWDAGIRGRLRERETRKWKNKIGMLKISKTYSNWPDLTESDLLRGNKCLKKRKKTNILNGLRSD